MDLPGIDVSRETIERLKEYQALVLKWNPSINLVSKINVDQLWERHIRDSAQLAGLVSQFPRRWVDLGSGGGFPALVLSAIAAELAPKTKFVLVESDQRKCVFLRTVVRTLSLNSEVINSRIEDTSPQSGEILSARALAPLTNLFDYSTRHLSGMGRLFLPKGKNYKDEIEAARQNWNFDVVAHDSLTDNEAKIIEAWNLERIK